jgi:AAA ATPase domain
MVQDFTWTCEALKKLRVGVRFPDGKPLKSVKLQPFEVIVAAVFARLRPDYDWWVTPNRPDGGVDFFGRGTFLISRDFGIDAAITVGGQCKKRERVNDVVAELSGSFVRMADSVHPTFFVAALSASLNPKRLADARRLLERTFQRHCHILDRNQLESLIGANLATAQPIIAEAFPQDAAYVLDYFRECSDQQTSLAILVTAPSLAAAGDPFRIRLQFSRSFISEISFRLRWKPSMDDAAATLVSPLGASSGDGVLLDFHVAGNEDPFLIEQDLEFLLYAVGRQSLGEVEVYSASDRNERIAIQSLPEVDVAENLRPPFYDVPYREPLEELERGFVRARTGRVTCVGVVGAGGAGKSRLCEEVGIEARRHGAFFVSVRQALTTEFPRRILANLLVALSSSGRPDQLPADQIDDVVDRLEPKLAARARPAIAALYEQAGKPGSLADDQALLSVLAVLIAQRSRAQTVVIHLQDLHWCTFDVLEILDRLIWQLDQLRVQISPTAPPCGMRVLFALEGRRHEHREESETGWSTREFERFIERLGCPVARCRAFAPHESFAFAQRLFEQPHSANRMLPTALLELQQQLIQTIHRVAGGNPLHMLEHVQLLRKHRVVAQNPRTGSIYLVRPDLSGVDLPPTVFETIEARWRYYRRNEKSLAVLLWAVALADDNLPLSLFDFLWSSLAPEITRARIESAEFLHFPQRDEEGSQVSFRHENYFQTMRRVQLPVDDRRTVVDAYRRWFKAAKGLGPSLRYVLAKIELEAPSPDRKRVRSILTRALNSAETSRDRSLVSRILATLLDEITWPSDRQKQLSIPALIQACDEEVELCENLVRSGNTNEAGERIQRVLTVIGARLRSYPAKTIGDLDDVRRRKYELLAMQAEILFHDRRPAEALAITSEAVAELNVMLAGASEDEWTRWRDVVMEVRDTHSAAVALAGDVRRAVVEARQAAHIAETLLETAPTRALRVIITYANILLCEAPKESEALLQRYLVDSERPSVPEETRLRLEMNLSMARLLIGYHENGSRAMSDSGPLAVAYRTLSSVFRRAYPIGYLTNAAAAALLLGLICAVRGEADEVGEIEWFSRSVSLAVRARQMETLWRAYINLAHSLYRDGQSPHDPAAAALDIMTESLKAYPEADRTPRFDLLAVPMAHATRYLILAGDENAQHALRAYPALRRMFSDLESGQLKDDRDGRTSHEWLRIGTADYVIY